MHPSLRTSFPALSFTLAVGALGWAAACGSDATNVDPAATDAATSSSGGTGSSGGSADAAVDAALPPDPDQCAGVALPQAFVDPTPPPAGRVVAVRAGDDLQAALDAAVRGDELVLDAGATFTGNFELPDVAGDGWITVRSAVAVPARGTRLRPEDASQLASLVSPNGNSALRTRGAAHHWRLAGLHVRYADDVLAGFALVSLGDAGEAQDTLAEVPHHLLLDHLYVHGGAETSFQRCIALNSAHTAILDSTVAECHSDSNDSQAICGWNGPGPFLIENNTLEGSTENVMFGGGDSEILELAPADIVFRRNYLHKPDAWLTSRWTVKNLFEIKSATRIVVEENVMEGNWIKGQTGIAWVVKGDAGRNARTLDVTMRRNLTRRSAGGASFHPSPAENFPPESAMDRVCVLNNLFDQMARTSGYEGAFWAVALLGPLRNFTFERNTALGDFSNQFIFEVENAANVLVRANVVDRADYGFQNSGRLAETGTNVVVDRNVLFRATFNETLPATNCVVDALTPVPEACAGAGADEARIRALAASVVP